MHWSRAIGFVAAAVIPLLLVSWYPATGQPPGPKMPEVKPIPAGGDTAKTVTNSRPGTVTGYVLDKSATAWSVQSSAEQDLERQAQDLARQYGRAKEPAEREKLRAALGEVLQKLFDAQQKRRKDEVDRIEEHVKRLRELIRKRDEAKTDIVRRRADQLLLDADGLGWGGPDFQHLYPLKSGDLGVAPPGSVLQTK